MNAVQFLHFCQHNQILGMPSTASVLLFEDGRTHFIFKHHSRLQTYHCCTD